MNIFNRTKPLHPVTLSYEEILEYEAAFKAVDVDDDGHIDVKELGMLLVGVGLRRSEDEISTNQGSEMIKSVDHDGDFPTNLYLFAVLNLCEFINLMSRQHNPFVTPFSQFKAVFRVFDGDNSGNLTHGEFKDLIFSLGNAIRQRCSEDELRCLLSFLDRDDDGNVSEEEFMKFFLQDSPKWLERLAEIDTKNNGEAAARVLKETLDELMISSATPTQNPSTTTTASSISAITTKLAQARRRRPSSGGVAQRRVTLVCE
eukprot:sb/3479732/